VPLTGEFVPDDEAANLLAAQELQKASNAKGAAEKAKGALSKTRSGKVPTTPLASSAGKPKAAKKSNKTLSAKKGTPSKKKKAKKSSDNRELESSVGKEEALPGISQSPTSEEVRIEEALPAALPQDSQTLSSEENQGVDELRSLRRELQQQGSSW